MFPFHDVIMSIWQQLVNFVAKDYDLFSFTNINLKYFNSYLFKSNHAKCNSLWRSDAKWRQKVKWLLAQVMACCLTASSHYLDQCWPPITEVLWHSYEDNFTASAQANIHEIENYSFKSSVMSPKGQCINSLLITPVDHYWGFCQVTATHLMIEYLQYTNRTGFVNLINCFQTSYSGET